MGKYSCIRNIIGNEFYSEFKNINAKIVLITSISLIALWLLSSIVHWKFISDVLNLTTGSSLIFLAYILILAVHLEKEVDISIEYSRHTKKHLSDNDRKAIRKNKAFSILLIIFGITAIIATNRYKRHYAFECSTVLVDHQNKIYHLNYDNECENILKDTKLEQIKAYKIEDTYSICEWCKEWAIDAEETYESFKHYRK